MRSIRTRDYLYIWNLAPERWPAGTPHYQRAQIPRAWLGDCDNGPAKLYMVNNQVADDDHRRLYDLSFGKRPEEELYDLRKDPDQMVNVVHDSDYRSVRDGLRRRLKAELEAAGDPRLHGGGERFETYPYYGGSPLWPGE